MATKTLAIVGQTASGKSSLAMRIAKDYNGEIIAADSRTIYKGMDIGTAKPNQEEQDLITHHGLDLVNPNQKFSVFDFKNYAKERIEQIKQKNKLPIMVGGTGLYVDSVLYNFQFNKVDKAKTKQLEALNLEKLQKLAKKIDKNISKSMLHNKRHLIRFIERGGHAKKSYKEREDLIIVGIFPKKSRLRDNINARVEVMFRQGLRKEVKELVEQYDWNNEAMSGIGYQEFKDYYDGKISMSKVKRNIVQNTLKYAKRQKTWFKRNPYLNRFEDLDKAESFIRAKLNQQDTL